jgi:hypothetical protein
MRGGRVRAVVVGDDRWPPPHNELRTDHHRRHNYGNGHEDRAAAGRLLPKRDGRGFHGRFGVRLRRTPAPTLVPFVPR